MFNGVIDHAGNGFYALSEPIILDYGTHYYYINVIPHKTESKHVTVGISLSRLFEEVGCKTMRPSAIAILKSFPCIKDIVDAFPKTLEDESNLKYANWKSRRGLAELDKEGLTRFFHYQNNYISDSYHRELLILRLTRFRIVLQEW